MSRWNYLREDESSSSCGEYPKLQKLVGHTPSSKLDKTLLMNAVSEKLA